MPERALWVVLIQNWATEGKIGITTICERRWSVHARAGTVGDLASTRHCLVCCYVTQRFLLYGEVYCTLVGLAL